MASKRYDNSNIPKINEKITAEKVRLVGSDGEMVGVISLENALQRAQDSGLDLVEVAPDSSPPVCKIFDYSKHRFAQQRQKKQSRSKQKIVHLKEIKLRPTIDKHDYEVKMRSIVKFLKAGDKVKISLRFRGREITHSEIGMELVKRIRDEVDELAKPELEPKMEGRQIIMILMPR